MLIRNLQPNPYGIICLSLQILVPSQIRPLQFYDYVLILLMKFYINEDVGIPDLGNTETIHTVLWFLGVPKPTCLGCVLQPKLWGNFGEGIMYLNIII